MVNLWLRHKVDHIFKWQIDDKKMRNLTLINTKIIITFFSNVSDTSPNYLGKTFKLVLFECWFLCFWDKDECPILKITIQSITQTDIFWKISEIKIFKRNDWEVNKLCLSQMLLAERTSWRGKKYNEVWWETVWLRRQWRWRTGE